MIGLDSIDLKPITVHISSENHLDTQNNLSLSSFSSRVWRYDDNKMNMTNSALVYMATMHSPKGWSQTRMLL